jgi:hypothetical protein
VPPTWLTLLAWTALAVAFTGAAVILIDMYGRGYRQHTMPVMEAVWPITALYFARWRPGATSASAAPPAAAG